MALSDEIQAMEDRKVTVSQVIDSVMATAYGENEDFGLFDETRAEFQADWKVLN